METWEIEQNIQTLRQNVNTKLEDANLYQFKGTVAKLLGLTVEVKLPGLKIGDLCYIETDSGEKKPAEVVAFKGDVAQLLLLLDGAGIGQGSLVTSTYKPIYIPAGDFLLGRLIDPMGAPMDGKPIPMEEAEWIPIEGPPPGPFERPIITEMFSTGVRAIDSCLTFGCGQRMGLFAGSGVGKSTLLGMIARNSDSEVNVVALIGERGREVREFIEKNMGPEGMKRTVVVAATSEQPDLVKIKAAFVATSIAEYFRDQGKDVLFMLDSVTRIAMAQRVVGLSAGEPPAMKGYTPSVFAIMPQLMERAGCNDKGSITALYTVLVEGDDFNEPISDTARSILDGHIMLTRELAHRNHYPAVDVLQSISRVMGDVTTKEHREAAARIKNWLAVYKKNEDLINIGAYVKGSNPLCDEAIAKMDTINAFLRQTTDDNFGYEKTVEDLMKLAR